MPLEDYYRRYLNDVTSINTPGPPIDITQAGVNSVYDTITYDAACYDLTPTQVINPLLEGYLRRYLNDLGI